MRSCTATPGSRSSAAWWGSDGQGSAARRPCWHARAAHVTIAGVARCSSQCARVVLKCKPSTKLQHFADGQRLPCEEFGTRALNCTHCRLQTTTHAVPAAGERARPPTRPDRGREGSIHLEPAAENLGNVVLPLPPTVPLRVRLRDEHPRVAPPRILSIQIVCLSVCLWCPRDVRR